MISFETQPLGKLGLFGSGEYTEKMLPLEKELVEAGIKSGKTGGYIQFATAAGQESADRIEYWKNLGKAQAERIGVEWKFIPVLNRENVNNSEFLEMVTGASLIYFSGGDPVHLVKTFKETELLSKIISEFSTGTSLAGCSAGAMALSADAGIHWRKNSRRHEGFGVLPGVKIFPHYDKYFSRIPAPIRNKITDADYGQLAIGIDENTGLIWENHRWQVKGSGYVHILGKRSQITPNKFSSGEFLDFLDAPKSKF